MTTHERGSMGFQNSQSEQICPQNAFQAGFIVYLFPEVAHERELKTVTS